MTHPINNFSEGDVVCLPGCEGGSRVTILRISDSGVTVSGFASFPAHTMISGQSPASMVAAFRDRQVKGSELLDTTPVGVDLLDLPPAGADLLELTSAEELPTGWELLGDAPPDGSDLLS